MKSREELLNPLSPISRTTPPINSGKLLSANYFQEIGNLSCEFAACIFILYETCTAKSYFASFFGDDQEIKKYYGTKQKLRISQ